MLKRKGRRNPYQSARNKFGVVPKELRTYEDQLFASKGEMIRFLSLKNLERGGAIRNLRRQVKFELILPDGTPIMAGKKIAVFTPDFTYEELRGQKWVEVIEDFKGTVTGEAKLRMAVFTAIYKKAVTITH